MIIKELYFKYNIDCHKIYNLAIENNDDFIKIIPEIIYYKKGVWKDNKRTDLIKINICDIPNELKYIIDMMRDNAGFIGIKIKIKKEILEDKIILKTKLKLHGFIGKLINNVVSLRANFIITSCNDETNVKVNYVIKSMLMTEEISDKISYHIQKKLEEYYIKKIDKYFLEIT